jgi:hypothetical protein
VSLGVVPDILEDHTASIFRVKWSKKEPHMKKVFYIGMADARNRWIERVVSQ